jgi:hypothetical protein
MIDPGTDRCSRRDLEFETLSERHYGITTEIGASFAQAAAICLGRHHTPPVVVGVSLDDGAADLHRINWAPASARAQAAWANSEDATRDGAYAVVLAAVDSHFGFVALGHTAVGSGADYFIGPVESITSPGDGLIDFEDAIRLEISGIDRSQGEAGLARRVREKVQQAQRGDSNRPAVVGVVVFNMLRIVFRSVG